MDRKEKYRKALIKGVLSCDINDTNKIRYFERVSFGSTLYNKPHKRYETKWNLGTLYLEGVLRKKIHKKH